MSELHNVAETDVTAPQLGLTAEPLPNAWTEAKRLVAAAHERFTRANDQQAKAWRTERAAILEFLEIGRQLNEAKALVGKPERDFKRLLETNFGRSARTAALYMQIAKNVSDEDLQHVAKSDWTLRGLLRIAQEKKPRAPRGSAASGWLTPEPIVQRVRDALGGTIDLDPCFSPDCAVEARHGITAKEDGLSKQWDGHVFMSPPRVGLDQWVAKLISGYRAGTVAEAVALLPAKPDAAWWPSLDEFARIPDAGRLKFEGSKPAPGRMAIFYLGKDVGRFATAFEGVGPVFVKFKH